MTDSPLIATYFTLAGQVGPFDAVTVSPVPLPDRLRAAAAAGYAGIGFGHQDLALLIHRHGAREIRAMLDDHGLAMNEVEILLGWFSDGAARRESDRWRQFMLRTAGALGMRHIKVAGDLSDRHWPIDHLAESFAYLCDDAANAGLAATIELFPTSNIATLETGRAIVERAGRANGGLLLDIWHMVRGGIAMTEIAALPPGLVNHVEIDDGTLVPQGDFLKETIDARLPPGEGEFPLRAFFSALDMCRYAGALGVEILSHDFRAMTVDEAARRSLSGLRRRDIKKADPAERRTR